MPVTRPTACGKDCLTTTGISTLPIAMPAAATKVPPSTTHGPPTTRSTSPAVRTAIARPIARAVPRRRASSGAAIAARPKQMVGTAVSTLAQIAEAPRPSRTSPSTEDIEVTVGRRFAAASATPTTSRGVPTSAPRRDGPMSSARPVAMVSSARVSCSAMLTKQYCYRRRMFGWKDVPVPLVTARRGGLVDQVIGQLRSAITGGEWPVGARIPPESELASSLEVGRNTVREAVRALSHGGLLEVRQGDGTYVRATTELSGALRTLCGPELREVLEVRRTLEVEAARMAAARRTDADLTVLRAALDERDRAVAAVAECGRRGEEPDAADVEWSSPPAPTPTSTWPSSAVRATACSSSSTGEWWRRSRTA